MDSRELFTPLTDVSMLDTLVERSHNEPVLLFLHDRGCPISTRAYWQVLKLPADDIALVDVRRAHDVSREIERRTGVQHESPQFIVLYHGEAVWSASHNDIIADDIKEVVETYA